MSDNANTLPMGEPTIRIFENGNKFVEWNITSENSLNESILPGLNEKLSVNGIRASCSKSGDRGLVCTYEFSPKLPYETYWNTAVRNLLLIETNVGNLIAIENRPRKNWKTRFVVAERVGSFNIDKTALMLAAENADLALLKNVLAKSSTEEVNRRTPLGNTSLHYAIHAGNLEVVAALLDAGADINVLGEITALQYAAIKNLVFLKILIQRGGDIDFKNVYGETALMTAAARGNTEMVLWLLDNGANKNLRDVFGESAGDKAEKNKRYEVVKILS